MKEIKKICVLFILIMSLTMTSCASVVKEKPMFKHISSEVEYCVPAENGLYEVSLILENGEKFVYTSINDLAENDKKIYISMGYDFEEKVYKVAVIKPTK